MRFRLLECRCCRRRDWTIDDAPVIRSGCRAAEHEWWERFTFFAKYNGPGLAPDQIAYSDA